MVIVLYVIYRPYQLRLDGSVYHIQHSHYSITYIYLKQAKTCSNKKYITLRLLTVSISRELNFYVHTHQIYENPPLNHKHFDNFLSFQMITFTFYKRLCSAFHRPMFHKMDPLIVYIPIALSFQSSYTG